MDFVQEEIDQYRKQVLSGGYDTWFRDAVLRSLYETEVLLRNGLEAQVHTRLDLIQTMIASAECFFNQEITTSDIAARLEVHPETVRRWFRSGKLEVVGQAAHGEKTSTISKVNLTQARDEKPDFSVMEAIL